MADDEQNQQPPRYWFPYWSGVPQPPPPPRPSRPAVRQQLSRRLSPPSPAAAPSSPRRPPPSQHRQPATTTTATRGAAPPTPPQSQVSRPSPSRSSPLGPIREPPQAPASNNSNAGGAAAPAPAKPPSMPAILLLPAVPEAAPRQKDVNVVLPPERPVTQVQQPAAAEIKPHGHGKAADKEHKPHHKEEKEKEKEKKGEHKSKDKEKEKDHKEKKDETKSKEKEKDKKHHAGDDGKHKEAKADQGKLHREIKAGVADMVHKASGSGHAAGSGTSVITLAGENKGASMKVSGGKSKDGGEWHGGHGHRLDGRSGSDGKKAAGKPGMMTALINSNVQVINNSLLLQSSCSGGDPGVHLKLSAKSTSKDKQKHAGGGDKASDAGKK